MSPTGRGSHRHGTGHHRRHSRRRSRSTARLKLVLFVSIFLGVLGVASAGATTAFIRAFPLYEPISGAVESILEQRVWLFVGGLLLGLWLRHEQQRPVPLLPFPLVEMRKGVSRAPSRVEPLDFD